MAHAGALVRARRAVRRREHRAVVIYLAALALVVGLGAVPQTRQFLLVKLERVIDYWEDRWARRVDHGERLVAEGRYEEAIAYLEELDRNFPAPTVKHGWSTERERALQALGAAYEALDRRARTRATYGFLTAYDERNYRNHYLLGRAHMRFGDGDEALASFERVLAINPSHMPTVEHVAVLTSEAGDFPAATAVYERYLDAFRVADVAVSLGDATVVLPLPADGRVHVLEGAVSRPPGWRGELALEVDGFGFQVDAVTIEPPLRVGTAGSGPEVAAAPDGAWRTDALVPAGAGRFRAAAEGAQGAVRTDLALPDGAARVRLRIRAYKPVSAPLWEAVERSYRNQLDREGLARARARTLEPPGDAA